MLYCRGRGGEEERPDAEYNDEDDTELLSMLVSNITIRFHWCIGIRER